MVSEISPTQDWSGITRFLLTQTFILTIVNILMSGIVSWFVCDPVILGRGAWPDLFSEFAKSTLGPLVGFVIPLTLATRNRVAKGSAPSLHWPPLGFLPRNVVLRLLMLIGLTYLFVGVPAVFLFRVLVTTSPLTFSGLLIFKLWYGAALSLFVVPIMLAAAMNDRASPRIDNASAKSI